MHCHMRDMLVVLEEGNHYLLRYPKFEMFLTWWELNSKHKATEMCARGTERRLKRLREEEARQSMVVAFEPYGIHLEMAKMFKYLGRIIKELGNGWKTVVANIQK